MTEEIRAIIEEMAERHELETILNSPIEDEPPFDDGWLEFVDE